jgi:hypothetical protein
MVLSFEFLRNCKPCELLRVKIEDAAEFAILGAIEGRNLQVLVVLKEREPPFAISVMEAGYIDGDFDTYAALRYGKYDIVPEHMDRCEIGVGPLFTKPGSLVLSDGSKSLVIWTRRGTTIRYFDLASGTLHGEPSGSRAAFKSWSLWHDGLAPSPASMRLIRYTGET